MILSENTALRKMYFFRFWVSKSKGDSTGDILWDVPVLGGGLSSFRGPGRDGFWILALFPAVLIRDLRILLQHCRGPQLFAH